MTWEDFCAQCLPAPHTVAIQALRGTGPVGDILDQPVEVAPCWVEDKRKLVLASDGSQVVSETQVFAPAETVAPPGSKVTLPGGRETVVITCSVPSAAGMDLPEHAEIACQ